MESGSGSQTVRYYLFRAIIERIRNKYNTFTDMTDVCFLFFSLTGEYYRQVYLYSWLQDESQQVTISKLLQGFLTCTGVIFPAQGNPVNVPIRRTMRLSCVIPAKDTRESGFCHQNFPRRERGLNLGPL